MWPGILEPKHIQNDTLVAFAGPFLDGRSNTPLSRKSNSPAVITVRHLSLNACEQEK